MAELPAVTVTLVFEVELIAIGKIVVGSEAELFAKLDSSLPKRLTEFVSVAGALNATLAVTEIGG